MAFRLSTLNKCNRIAATMSPKRYLSADGHQLLQIIRLLLPESAGQPGAVCAQIVKIGRTYKWDLPRIPAAGEASFLLWLVMEVAQIGGLPAPKPEVVPGPVSASVASSREVRR